MSSKLYTDAELRRIADPIIEVRLGLHARRRPQDRKTEGEIRREVFHTITVIAIANRAACLLDYPETEVERPDLENASPEPPNGDTLSLQVANLVTNCVATRNARGERDAQSSFAPAFESSRLMQWAAAIDQATFDKLSE